jgi:hypothetical protein
MPAIDLLPYRLGDLDDQKKRPALLDDLSNQYPALRDLFLRVSVLLEGLDDVDALHDEIADLTADLKALRAELAALK